MLNKQEVRVPKVGMDTTEVTIATWLVEEGDKVEMGTPLAELESEKVTFVLESEADGEVVEIAHPQGTSVAVGEVICFLGIQD